MRKFFLILSILLALPAKALEPPKFDTFLPEFRYLYRVYHLGPRLNAKDVDLIAVRIWHGSGEDYMIASISACQGIFETHYNRSIQHNGHKGDIGMRNFTILAEAKRLGLIKSKKDIWILNYCERNPAFADKLAASRLAYLIGLYGSIQRTLFQYVRGNGWMEDTPKGKKDFKDCVSYYNGVMKLREAVFNGR